MNRWLHRTCWGATATGMLFLSPISASSEPTAAPNANGAKSADADRAVATWNGGQLTVADVEAVVAIKLPQERVTLAEAGGREQLLEELVTFDLLVQEAAARGYATRLPVVEAAKNAAIDAMYARDFVVLPQAITREEVEAYWKEKGPALQRPRARRGAVIVLATQAEAEALRRVLARADRAQFAKAAVERSIDKRTGHQGGELGYFDIEGTPRPEPRAVPIPKPIAEAVFALRKEGDVSKKPIAVEGGYAIVMYTGEMAAVSRTLADAEQEIREQLAAERMLKMRDDLAAKLHEEYKPEIKAELLGSVVPDPPRKGGIPQGSPAAPRDPREPLKAMPEDSYGGY